MEWVKADEVLPPYGHRILICDEHGWISTAIWNGNEFMYSDGEEVGYLITHWMPLSKPPKRNPSDLIESIGDPNFSICDETWDEIYRHPQHPHSLRIRDCEDDSYIDVHRETPQETMAMAIAMCKLLNQDYTT